MAQGPNAGVSGLSLTAIVTFVSLAIVVTVATSKTLSSQLFSSIVSVPSQDVIPIPCHSHNDYWRERPLHSALQSGCVGVEADVWAYDNELLIGHTRGDLTPGRTFQGMYIDPLVEILQDNNRPGSFSWLSSSKGVYNSDPGQTLVLLVDFKSEFEAIWPLLKVALEPLRRHGWLSRVRNGDTFVAPVTIVATGTPALAILDQKGRDNTGDIFIDAPLSRLNCDAYSTTNSYWASASLKETIGFWWFGYLWPGQLTPIKEQVAEAHRRGLKVRYWGLPSWPAVLRNHIWGSLSGAGVDIFNVDDLENAVGVLSPGTRPVR